MGEKLPRHRIEPQDKVRPWAWGGGGIPLGKVAVKLFKLFYQKMADNGADICEKTFDFFPFFLKSSLHLNLITGITGFHLACRFHIKLFNPPTTPKRKMLLS